MKNIFPLWCLAIFLTLPTLSHSEKIQHVTSSAILSGKGNAAVEISIVQNLQNLQKLQPGDSCLVEVGVLNKRHVDTMSIRWNSDPGLTIISPGETGRDFGIMEIGDEERLTFELLVDVEGISYLNLFVTTTTDGQSKGKVVAIPIRAGSNDRKQLKKFPTMSNAEGRSIIIMEASEKNN